MLREDDDADARLARFVSITSDRAYFRAFSAWVTDEPCEDSSIAVSKLGVGATGSPTAPISTVEAAPSTVLAPRAPTCHDPRVPDR